MHNYVRKTNCRAWLGQNLFSTSEEINMKKMSVNQAAKAFNIPMTTLPRLLQKSTFTRKKNLGNFQTAFSKEIEKELVKYIIDMQNRFFGLTQDAFRLLTYEYAYANNLNVPFNKDKKKQDRIGLIHF